jgi:hypothetical protein
MLKNPNIRTKSKTLAALVYGYSKIVVGTWIGNFDVESVANEDVSCGEVAMSEPMLRQIILCIRTFNTISNSKYDGTLGYTTDHSICYLHQNAHEISRDVLMVSTT